MIELGNFVSYIGLSQEWLGAEVKVTGDHYIFVRELFTCLGANFYCYSIDILYLDPKIRGEIRKF